MAQQVRTAAISFARFVRLALHGLLYLKHNVNTDLYSVENGKYTIFRWTERTDSRGKIVILVIGFRLKLIRCNPLLHWIFQRVCILTTPFWSGLPGFKTKLWMVDHNTKNYLGIYDWRGNGDARTYLNYLLPILRFFSVKGSVWAKQVYGQDLKAYLDAHMQKSHSKRWLFV